MIISKIFGGLGNQMFQYAFGLSLSLDKNTCLLLDISDTKQHNGFELESAFNIQANIATQSDMRKVLGIRSNKWLMRRIRRRPWLIGNRYISESQFHYDDSALNMGENSYLEGYWQSEKYFLPHRHEVLNSFTFNESVSSENRAIIKQIKESPISVSVHIRRGDYISNAKTNMKHGVMDVNYYRSAINRLNIRNDRALFILFSDDINWVKQNLTDMLGDQRYLIVDHNTDDQSYNDMRLMSLCRHNIIANSSFSWWGAYLNQNPDKKVVAPLRWFNLGGINTDTLHPKSWMRT